MAARLVEGTRGNPLALSEVAGRLTPAQRVGAAPLPDPLPVGARLELVYEPLLAGLSAPAWRAVLLCAAGPEGAAAGLVGALDQDGLDAGAALDEAEERGVLVRDGGSVAFRHPLLRSAAWRLATPAQRRAAHLALAGALPGEAARAARTWHLAEAAAGPDDVLAGELVAVAEEDRTRRGFAAAAAALERAALLTTDPGLAAERLAAAVGDAFLAGDVERTRALAARVLEGPAGRRRPRPGAAHPGGAGAVRRVGPARRRAAGRRGRAGRRPAAGVGAGRAGQHPVPAQRPGRRRRDAPTGSPRPPTRATRGSGRWPPSRAVSP